MFFLVDIVYLLALPVLLCFALISRIKGHPRRKDIFARFGYGRVLKPSEKRVLLHAVSVGEVNTLRKLVPDLIQLGYDVVVCVTTDTGLARAKDLFSSTCVVTRYPFDFSFAVRRFLYRIQPTIVALVELEVWPNFINCCSRRSIPVVIVNGRLSERSFKKYKLVKPLLTKTFSQIAAIGMQNDEYYHRVCELGGLNVTVEGTMKWDNAQLLVAVEGAQQLALDLQIDENKQLVVAGSTSPEEHNLLLKSIPEGVQLLCAPRKPEWFDDAAQTLAPCNRRSSSKRQYTNYFLLDTIGELDKAYALADIVVIGRSFAPLHGSDPSQSIALGIPTIIGPHVSDFSEMVRTLVEGEGLVQCEESDLADIIQTLLQNKEKQKELIQNGKRIIASLQGATKRYENLIVEHTPSA